LSIERLDAAVERVADVQQSGALRRLAGEAA
jgi:hypothetical protein